MKRLLSSFLFSFIVIFSFAQNQINNGDFENWTDQYNAIGWNSLNTGIHSAVRTTDSNTGDYAASLTTNSIIISNIPGIITLGIIDEMNFTVYGGIPFTDRPTGLSYSFKYTPIGNDTSYMIALLTAWNESELKPDTIGITAYFTNNTVNEYTKVSVPFVYTSEQNPDTINVIFLSSGFESHAGSNLKIDDLVCEYGLIISPTLCFPAVDITSSQFTANWLTMSNADSYSIDVSEDTNFNNFLIGYENLNTNTDTFCIVNIIPGTYYYRVRVHYGDEVSINSNTIQVTVLSNDIPNIPKNSVSLQITENKILFYATDIIQQIELYDSMGRLISIYNGSKSNAELSLNKRGIYIAKIKVGNDFIQKKIIF
jgi:hypothetical protein